VEHPCPAEPVGGSPQVVEEAVGSDAAIRLERSLSDVDQIEHGQHLPFVT
jgi:hypothetical protein